MNELLTNSVFFGIALSLCCYFAGVKLQKKTGIALLNPLPVAAVMIIVILCVLQIDYETYDIGAKYITYFLTPATVCLAVPLYRQVKLLKENAAAILCGILAGCVGHALVVAALGLCFALDRVSVISILPKSVTTPIAMGVCEESGGITGIVVIGVMIAGNIGAVFAPALLKLIKITEPEAQGLGIGCCSHALGTSTAVKLGEVQAAMSSLAIVVTGIMTVIIVPIVAKFL